MNKIKNEIKFIVFRNQITRLAESNFVKSGDQIAGLVAGINMILHRDGVDEKTRVEAAKIVHDLIVEG